jgi:hypothetical protein
MLLCSCFQWKKFMQTSTSLRVGVPQRRREIEQSGRGEGLIKLLCGYTYFIIYEYLAEEQSVYLNDKDGAQWTSRIIALYHSMNCVCHIIVLAVVICRPCKSVMHVIKQSKHSSAASSVGLRHANDLAPFKLILSKCFRLNTRLANNFQYVCPHNG